MSVPSRTFNASTLQLSVSSVFPRNCSPATTVTTASCVVCLVFFVVIILLRFIDHTMATGWPRVGHCHATGWPLSGHGLATGWPRVGHWQATGWPLAFHRLTSRQTTWPQTGHGWPQADGLNTGWPQADDCFYDAQKETGRGEVTNLHGITKKNLN